MRNFIVKILFTVLQHLIKSPAINEPLMLLYLNGETKREYTAEYRWGIVKQTGNFDIEVIVKDTSQPASLWHTREELLIMLRTVRKEEIRMGWVVPEPTERELCQAK